MIVACPNCEKKLRLATLKSGQRVRCPECQTVFAPEAEEEEPPRKEAVTTRASSTRAPRREEVDEEEDERPQRPRRGRDEDEADEAPPEERADEEDEEERPRRKKKRRKQKAFPLLPVLGGGVALAVGLVVFFLVSNPFGTSSAYAKHEAIAKELLGVMTDLLDTLDTVKDRNSARAAVPKLNDICNRLDKIAGEIGSLPNISYREDKKFQEAYAAKFSQLNGRGLSTGPRAAMNSQGEPSFIAALQRLESVEQRLQAAKPKWSR